MHPNLVVNALIGELPVHCGYGHYGCNATVPYSDLTAHMSSCAYHPVQCPHHSFGCAWKGAASELSAHIKSCVFEQLKEYLHKTEQQISLFKHTIELQSQEINKLKRLVHERHTDGEEERHVIKAVSGQERSNTQSHVPEHKESPGRWKVQDMKCVRSLWGHVRGVTALAVYNSSILLSGSHDTKIRLWDLTRDCKCVAQLEGKRHTHIYIHTTLSLTPPHRPSRDSVVHRIRSALPDRVQRGRGRLHQSVAH